MGVDDYSTDPNANTEISGINVAEGCAPGNINNAIRQLMADVADGLVQYYTQAKPIEQRQIARQNIGLGNVDDTRDANKPISTATQTALNGKVDTSDSRLTNAREWTATTVSQAEAEAGTATTRRAWTALRVRQAIQALAIGEGQTWQDMTASRSVGTVYHNTTGKPIMVAICSYNGIEEVSPNGSTGWVRVGEPVADSRKFQSFIVPNGHRYRCRGAGNIQSWSELR